MSDQEVMQRLLGYKLLPSEGDSSVLALVQDRAAQRLLRHLIRRNPSVRWVCMGHKVGRGMGRKVGRMGRGGALKTKTRLSLHCAML